MGSQRERGRWEENNLLPQAWLGKKAGNRSLKEQMTLTRDARVKCVLGGGTHEQRDGDIPIATVYHRHSSLGVGTNV